ncbi:ribonucleoside triphosphate reductase [Candidatus Thioglobus sp.]|jgi:ribonucleoside-triphosphate reductase|uniref:ribonucleoside triphosphate reductase n=1 Tax=Candidatus Thioglobus sp. TaxID=2026721 RepID=UPI001D25CDFA|nr:ribonucleoside triphosphate reductase [Candidatus Thioglobus sp.]MBT3277475.1 ribonucleoside triphosphate reductase [Candidatus Thioglobus sp.]MBT3447382.1 ribonucleoside triphosphate reductase [Candidatus Thioglobus sp.]MBT3745185.1 ribonucleoside triphosphate reductase [Candidatus Thioglobus sp.]MBT4001490.1 ribonucleoside triphosphate reductase [Candidatus Thioglobus sp.]MBT4181494.1 ribonucleoside triphosphate reductase [Candidatus Thioglobus sp.]
MDAIHANAPLSVVKRDGSSAFFDSDKIRLAIFRAGQVSEELDDNEAKLLTLQVLKVLSHQEDIEPDIEHIQDVVEQALISSNFVKTARAYIAYRQQHKTLRDDKKTLVDVASSINEYLDRADWRVNANANQGYSLGGLILNVSGKVIANYWLSHVYAPEVGSAHRQGDLHIHDLDMLAGYCAGWSLRTLLREGLNGVEGRIEAGPPKHLSSAVGQMVNFLGTLQNEWAGAQAFSSFDTYLAPYIRLDSLGYGEVKQCIQELIYNLNVPSRWGTQTPFTNLTFDWVCPEDLRDQVPMMGDEEMPFTYGELQVEMDMINQAYIEVMTEGDAKGRVFTFPIPTYNMTEDFPWESENAKRLFDMTAKYGLPYFQNFLNSDLKPNMVRSMCCRLQLDLNELLKRGNGLFGSAEQTGSLGVVTINCARLGHVYKGDSKGLYEQLDKLLLMAKDSLEVKRKVVQKLMDNGLFPYTKRYLGTLRNHFSTIGVNGINEMIRNFSQDKEDITSTDGYPMAVEFLDHIRLRMIEFQEQTGHMFNLEATPAEGTTYRFAKEDMKRYPDILHAGTKDKPYYTNSSQLPVGYTADPFEALEKQDELQTKYTGGTVLHLYMGERISSGEACMKMVKRSLTNFRLPYITITPTFSICPTHGYLSGEHEYCPKCDEVLLANKKLKNQGDKNEKAKNIANQ